LDVSAACDAAIQNGGASRGAPRATRENAAILRRRATRAVSGVFLQQAARVLALRRRTCVKKKYRRRRFRSDVVTDVSTLLAS